MGAMNKITDNILLGSFYSLGSPKYLKKDNVTHILSLVETEIKPEVVEGFTHLKISIDDIEDENIIQYFPKIIEFMDEAINAGNAVLVHCMAGVSRSATAVCAYLMRKHVWTPEQALTFVKSKRSVANPNSSFLDQLRLFYQCGYEVSETKAPYRQWLLKQRALMNGLVPAEQIVYTTSEGGVQENNSESPISSPARTWRNTLPTLLYNLGHRHGTPTARPQQLLLSGGTEEDRKETELSLDGIPENDLRDVVDPTLKLIGFWACEIVLTTNQLSPLVAPNAKRGTQLRCKKCATCLALSTSFIVHTPPLASKKEDSKEANGTSNGKENKFMSALHRTNSKLALSRSSENGNGASSSPSARQPQINYAPRNGLMSESVLPACCMQFFIEPVAWMRPELEKGELEGKLSCPKCDSKVGSYKWSGNKCSCGIWVTPAIQIQRSKVDEMVLRNGVL